jgi:hypothetical protein
MAQGHAQTAGIVAGSGKTAKSGSGAEGMRGSRGAGWKDFARLDSAMYY